MMATRRSADVVFFGECPIPGIFTASLPAFAAVAACGASLRLHAKSACKLGRRLVEQLFHKGTMRLQAREVKAIRRIQETPEGALVEIILEESR